MNSLGLLPPYPVRVVTSPQGLHGLADPYMDLTKLFLLNDPQHSSVTSFWLHCFLAKPNALAVMCSGKKIVAKLLLQCDIETDGRVFGHIGHYSSFREIKR